MNVEISSEAEMWTEIVVRNANGDVLFDGWLKREPGSWVLERNHNGYGARATRWSDRRDYLSVLAAALKFIELLARGEPT